MRTLQAWGPKAKSLYGAKSSPPTWFFSDLLGNFSGTLQNADEILAMDSTQPGARLMRSVGLTGLGRLDEAESELQRVLRTTPRYADARLHLAQVRVARGKFKEAEAVFRELYKPGTSDVRALDGLARSLVAQKRAPEALQLVSAELKGRPASIELRLLSARTAAEAQQGATAAEHYDWLATKSQSADVLLEAGHYERSQQRSDQAIERYLRARELAPDDFRPPLALAGLYRDRGRRKEAIDSYKQAVLIAPHNPIVLNDYAFCLSESDDSLNEALQLATKARAAAPDLVETADTLAWIYVKKNQPDTAIQILRNLTKARNAKGTYHYHLGAALLRKGDAAEAKEQLRIALSRQLSTEEEEIVRDMLRKLP